MTWLKPSVSRFVSKFVCEIIPAGVASMIGAALFALVWPGPIPVATETTASDTIVAQNEQIAQLIRDEHEAMLAFLKLEEKREIARQLPTIKEVRTSAEAEHTARHSTSVRVAEATKSVPRAKPAELPAVVE